MEGFGQKHIKVQTAWATAKSVDWNKKTMVCTGVADDLDYEGVLLGVGYCYLKPKVGTLCLVGMIENNAAAAFLIDAEEIEEMDIKTSVKLNLNANELVINGGGNDGVPISDKVAKRLNKVENDMNSLKQVFSGWVPVSQDGGAALKAAATSWAGQQLKTTVATDILNDKVKH